MQIYLSTPGSKSADTPVPNIVEQQGNLHTTPAVNESHGTADNTSSSAHQTPGARIGANEAGGPTVTIAFPPIAHPSSHWDTLLQAITRSITNPDLDTSNSPNERTAEATSSICAKCGEQVDEYYVVGRGLSVGIFRFGSERDALVTGVRNNYSRKHSSLSAALAEWNTILHNASWEVVPPTPGQTVPTFSPVVGLPAPAILVTTTNDSISASSTSVLDSSVAGGPPDGTVTASVTMSGLQVLATGFSGSLGG